MKIEDRMAWTRWVVRLPQHVAHGVVVEQLLHHGESMLAGILSPQNPRDWEFNARVETLQAAAERHVLTKLTPVCPISLDG